jgi:signal transduction histidine kinase/ActR/RegA family two-component response regulator
LANPFQPLERVLDQLVEQMQDHRQTLMEFSARLEKSASALLEAWANAYTNLAGEQSAEQQSAALDRQVALIQSFLGQVKQGNLRQAFADVADWSQSLAHAQMSYDQMLQLIRAQQYATLSLVLPYYQNDPQLPLMLDALDDWFDNVVTIAGVAYNNVSSATPAPIPEPRYIDAATQRVVGELTGGMLHALNNLFTGLIGQTEILVQRANDPATRAALQEIQDNARAGAQGIKRIQEYAGGGENFQIVDVNAALRDASEITRFLWRDQAEQRGVVIDVVKDFAQVPPVLAQPTQLRQALVALLLNAIDAMPNGGLITLRTERQAGNVIISIIDNGEGMSNETRARALEPFFTTRPSPHLGLGLTIAARTIAANHGTLTLASQPGNGTTVTLVLPMTQPPVERKEEQVIPLHQTANILVIDNESSVRTLLSRLLSLQGHSVVTAESGAEGVALFKRQKFDVVFTDLGMPEMSGWDVARELKKLDGGIFIALTTGWPIDLLAEELEARGVDRVVSKPFDLPMLYGLINQAMAQKK